MTVILEMLRQIINVSLCRRRVPTSDNSSDEVSKPVYSKLTTRPYAAVALYESTDASGPDNESDSFYGSDAESDSTDLMPNSEPSIIDTDSEVDFSDEETSRSSRRAKIQGWQLAQSRLATSLNPHAAPFIPGAVALRDEAVDEGTPQGPYAPVEATRLPLMTSDEGSVVTTEEWDSEPAEVVDPQTLGTLLEALSKLTPAEAGKLRAFLDDHLASQENASQSGNGSGDHTDLSECSSAECAPVPARIRTRTRTRGTHRRRMR